MPVSLDSLSKTVFETSLGPVPVWSDKGALESDRPALVTITSAFADRDHMSRMQQVVGDEADAFLVHLPGVVWPIPPNTSVAAFAAAVSEILNRDFANRLVVLHGVGVGALVALAVRASPVRRVVAVEPPLDTGKLWPVFPTLRRRLREPAQDAAVQAFIGAVFGVTAAAVEPRRYLGLLDGWTAPIDVLVGATPLLPERPLEHYPSLVDEPEREALRGLAGVTLHIAEGSGHNVASQAPYILRDLLLAACRAVRDSAIRPSDLLLRTPLTAARVLYAGPAADAFAAAYLARNPKAQVHAAADLADAAAGPFDTVVALRLQPDQAGVAAARLADGGQLVVGFWPSSGDTLGVLPQALAAAGFETLAVRPAPAQPGHFDDLAGDLRTQPSAAAAIPAVAVLRKPGGAPPVERLAVHLASFAPRLMDIRTRLPAQAMRSAPDVAVIYSGAPFSLPSLPPGAPKVLILQRPAMIDVESWRRVLAQTIRDGWVVVLEYDDHPELVAQANSRVLTPEAWARYGYPHGIQTSTRQLGELFGRFNPEVKVLGNAAFEIAAYPDRPAPRRVFYGAVSRGDFAVQVIRTLGPVAEEFPEVEFVVLGDRRVFDALPAGRKVFHDFVPYERYLELMGDSAVSLSPIEGSLHQDTKSDAKFLDAAGRGVVTLASPTIYAETVRHAETGLIAERVEDWVPLLAGALRDEPARLRMAQAAWTYVRHRRMFADQLPERLAWYRDLWARREALNAGVLARLPGLAEALAPT
jgi:hypothetical protein